MIMTSEIKVNTRCTGCQTTLVLNPMIRYEQQKRNTLNMRQHKSYALDYRNCGYYCVLCEVENREYRLERI